MKQELLVRIFNLFTCSKKCLYQIIIILFLSDYGLPSTIELRFIPRGPQIIEQPVDLEFGKIDPTVLGSSYIKMKNEIVVTLNCLADGYPIPQYE